MPPKKAAAAPGKKAVEKKKEKVLEDKTFGLKNKKGAKNQKFIQQVQKQVANKFNTPVTVDKKDEKKKKEQELLELNAIFKPVVQKVSKDADPRSVLCAFFKQGLCTKGNKCKFSHDLAQERRAEKKNVYHDEREEGDTMENWDEEKLREVVEKKHAEEKALPKTDIICRDFLSALENNKYGWFWECPSGGNKCHYKHCLPPGFVLKKDKKKEAKGEELSIEDLVETERAALGHNLTKITLETFLAWKKRKIAERKATNDQESERKKAEFKAGNKVGLSGRDMFTFNPDMANDDGEGDEDDGAAFDMRQREDEEEVAAKEINLEELCKDPTTNVEGPGTVADKRHWEVAPSTAAAGSSKEEVPINEDLFNEEDLEGLEDELEDLDVDDEDED